jgi:hypothetical protein
MTAGHRRWHFRLWLLLAPLLLLGLALAWAIDQHHSPLTR